MLSVLKRNRHIPLGKISRAFCLIMYRSPINTSRKASAGPSSSKDVNLARKNTISTSRKNSLSKNLHRHT